MVVLDEHGFLGTGVGPFAVQTEFQTELFHGIELEIQDVQEELAAPGRLERIRLHEGIAPAPMGQAVDGEHIVAGGIEAGGAPLRKGGRAHQGRKCDQKQFFHGQLIIDSSQI